VFVYKGLVNEASEYFKWMLNQYCNSLMIQYYGYMVDLYNIISNFEDGWNVVKLMPMRCDEMG